MHRGSQRHFVHGMEFNGGPPRVEDNVPQSHCSTRALRHRTCLTRPCPSNSEECKCSPSVSRSDHNDSTPNQASNDTNLHRVIFVIFDQVAAERHVARLLPFSDCATRWGFLNIGRHCLPQTETTQSQPRWLSGRGAQELRRTTGVCSLARAMFKRRACVGTKTNGVEKHKLTTQSQAGHIPPPTPSFLVWCQRST